VKVAVLFSGGKDSCFAVWYALHQGWDVAALITVFSENPDSFMFHTPNVAWTRLQAEAMSLPQFEIATGGVKGKELGDLRNGIADVLKRQDFTALLSGAILSEYQKTRIDHICEDLQLRSFAPFWHKDPLMLLEEEVALGFEFVLSSCAAAGLGREWLGKRIDSRSVEELTRLAARFNVNPAFEGGEAETFVTDAPIFRKRVMILEAEERWRLDAGRFLIKRAVLAGK